MRKISPSSQFKKSYKIVKQYPNFSEAVFNEVVNNLANDIPLDEKYKDHPTKGKIKDCRDCHIAPDIVLLYRKSKERLELFLIDIGNHSNIF